MTMTATTDTPPVVEAAGFSVHSAGRILLDSISLTIPKGQITAIIGPASSGKSLFLRCINRLAELDHTITTSGSLIIYGHNIQTADPATLRRKVGMVFTKPSLPVAGIFDNVCMAPRMMGITSKSQLRDIVERSLRTAGLWDAVSGQLNNPAAGLSPEQQQRLCIARALAADPILLLFDEPTAHLDFPSAGHIEDLICQLATTIPVIVAAQTPQQAAHIADITAFFLEGKLIETAPTTTLLTSPQNPKTEAYVTGRLT